MAKHPHKSDHHNDAFAQGSVNKSYPSDNSRGGAHNRARGGESQINGLEPLPGDSSPLAQQHREVSRTAARARAKR